MSTAPRALAWLQVWRHRAVVGCGVLTVGIGGGRLLGWALGQEVLNRTGGGLGGLTLTSALSLVALGVALLLTVLWPRATWRRWVTGGLAAAVIVVAGEVLIEDATGTDLGLDLERWQRRVAGAADFPRVPPVVALGLLLCAVACGLLRSDDRGRRWLALPGVVAVVTVAVAVVSLSGTLTGVELTYGWGKATTVSIPESLALGLLGVGIFGATLGAATQDDAPVPRWIPLLFFVGGFTAAAVAALALAELNRSQIRAGIRQAAQGLAEGLAGQFQEPAAALRRMAGRHAADAQITRDKWDLEARVFLEAAPDCRALHLVAPDFQSRFSFAPADATGTPETTMRRSDPQWRALISSLTNAPAGDDAAISPATMLPSGGRGFLLCVPVPFAGRTGDHLVAEFRLTPFLSRALTRHAVGWNVVLNEGDRMISRQEVGAPASVSRWAQTTRVAKAGEAWSVVLWPTAAAVTQQRSALPWVTLTVGSLLAVLLGLAVQLVITTRAQHFAMTAANARLTREIEERKIVEQALETQRQQLQAILDNCTACIYVKNLRGEYLLVNRQFEKLFHVTGAAVAGKTDQDLFPPALAAAFRANDLRVATEQRPLELEEVAPQDDGLHTYVSVKFPMLDPAGTIYGVCGISTDITERKQGEERLRTSHAALQFANDRLTGILEGAHDLVAALDLEFRLIAFNHAYQENFRKTFGRDLTLGMNLLSALEHVPDERASAAENWGRALRGEEFQVVKEFGDPARGRNFYEISYSSIRSEQGQLIGAAHFVRDITTRRRAELALQASEDRLSLALKSSHAGTWHWDMKTGRILWDDHTHALFGLAPGTFAGTYEAFAERLAAEDRERVRTDVLHSVEKGRDFDTEYRAVWPDGTVHWIAARGMVYRDAAGRPVSMVGVCWDVTRRKENENELKEMTMALARSNTDLQQFAYVASHDLQEPLRMVTSFLQLLSQRYHGKLDSEADEFINFAVDGARRMHQLISDLLAYSRVGSNRNPLQLIDTAAAFAAAQANLMLAIRDAGATVTCGPLPRIRGDEVQWVQLFQNLIGNAVKFHGERAPVVRVEAVREGPDWKFSVRDNGIGIEPQFHQRVFVIFQRLHAREQYAGTGIGLAVCKRIVERHGGRIWIESEPGHGTTFLFTVPAVKTEEPA
ncbi:hypothetical protein LBMAG56_47400 [Verrucomicrobiota bacterium]|nr:hypothetical protein LBMAG56_47400 [Verrucomicrobiota bacterium]